MKKNIKLIIGLTLGLAVSVAVAQTTTVDANVQLETVQQAGKRLYKAETLAYKSKKKVTRVFNYKAKNQGKAEDIAYRIDCATLKAQYGKGYIKDLTISGSLDYLYTKKDIKKVKKGIYAYKVTINGKNAGFRKDYRNIKCRSKLIIEVQSFTKGQNQFEKAWTTMVWLQARSAYYCGRHQKTTVYDLYKRQLATDCDGLASMYAFYAKAAGVKHAGTVAYDNHAWNWIKVNGKRYYIDYQGCLIGCTDANESVKELVDKYTQSNEDNWGYLYDLNKWYLMNINATAKTATNCKAVWDKLTAKQRKAFKKSYPLWDAECEYQFTCSSYAQSNFRPVAAFCNVNDDYTVKSSKHWTHE